MDCYQLVTEEICRIRSGEQFCSNSNRNLRILAKKNDANRHRFSEMGSNIDGELLGH